MKTVFFGTPSWAVPSLEALCDSPHSPTLVVSQPARRRGRDEKPTASAVAGAASRRGLPVLETTTLKGEPLYERIAAGSPGALVVVAFGRMFPDRLLDLAPHGAVNVHFSMLPRYRGAAPVQWAIAAGETVTGVSTIRLVAAMDAGPIYLQEEAPIEPAEHAPALGARLARIGASLIVRTLDGIADGSLVPCEQDHTNATRARLLRPEDGWVDWGSSAEAIARRVRGFDPWPGQASMCQRGRLRILEARAVSPGSAEGSVPPGTVLGDDPESIRIACGHGTVLAASLVQPESRRAMSGPEAIRGRQVEIGERLASPDAA